MEKTLEFIRLNESTGKCELVTWFRNKGVVSNSVTEHLPTAEQYKDLMQSQFREIYLTGKEFLHSEDALKKAVL